MENIKVGYMPVGQAVRKDYKTMKIGKFFKDNKLGLIIGGISMVLLSTYVVLIVNFTNLIKLMY